MNPNLESLKTTLESEINETKQWISNTESVVKVLIQQKKELKAHINRELTHILHYQAVIEQKERELKALDNV